MTSVQYECDIEQLTSIMVFLKNFKKKQNGVNWLTTTPD